jgi:hypothetical protein
MRRVTIPAVAITLISCSNQEYRIPIHSIVIEQVTEEGGSGYALVPLKTLDELDSSGDIYISGRRCLGAACRDLHVGYVEKIPLAQSGDHAKLRLSFSSAISLPSPGKFWLKNISCLKFKASKGVLGRPGSSDWYCSLVWKVPRTQAQAPGSR